MAAAAAPLLMSDFDREARHLKAPPADHSEYQRRIFQDMLNRTANSLNLHRFSASENEAPPPEKLRLVSIRSSLDIQSESQVAFAEFRDGTQLLRAKPKFQRKRWVETRLEELREALELKPDIICFPEFAFPPPPAAPEGGWTLDEINRAVAKRLEFEDAALTLMRNHESRAFVFLGSYHCLMTLYNVGVIYPWGERLDGTVTFTEKDMVQFAEDDLDVITRTTDRKVESPIYYRKRYPARKMGERTRVPTGRDFNIFKRNFGQVGVIICSDILDLNQFGMFIREGFDPHKGYDFILVPAYNTGTSFGAMCRDLSYMSATTVILVNAQDPAAQSPLPASEIYVCGQRVRESDGSLNAKLQGILSFASKGLPSGALLEIFEMDLPKVKHARRSHLNLLRLGRPSPDLTQLSIT
jgi:predicted amidohydrolase